MNCAVIIAIIIGEVIHYVNSMHMVTAPNVILRQTTRKPVVFLHITKAAGHEMCFLAQLNGEHVDKTVDNGLSCNALADDFNLPNFLLFRHITVEQHEPLPPELTPLSAALTHLSAETVTCAQRWNYVRENDITWQQIEREFKDEDYCPKMFSYATLVRDPLRRMESFLNFQVFNPPRSLSMDGFPDIVSMWKSIKGCLLDGQSSCHGSKSPNTLTMFVHFDNYMVRVLGGPSVMQLPPKAINTSHVEKALHVLSKFDIVARMEDIGKSFVSDMFRQTFGWEDLSLLAHAMNSLPHTFHNFSETEEAQLRELNKHDYTLYTSVKSL